VDKELAWLSKGKCRELFLLTDEELDACQSPEEVNILNTRKVHELFFPQRGENFAVKQASEICFQCPVQGECLRLSLDNNEIFGVWGGASGRTRRRIREVKSLMALSKIIEGDENDETVVEYSDE
jgi:hypothetical protein